MAAAASRPIVAAPAVARPESRPRSAESSREALTPRPSEGSLAPANREARQRLLVSSQRSPAFSWPGVGKFRGIRRVVVVASGVISFGGRNTTTPLRWQLEAGGGVVACSQLLVAVAGARRSPCGETRRDSCCEVVAVVVFVVLGGGVAGGGVVRGAGGLVCLLVGARQRPASPLVGARQPPPTLRQPQDKEQDRCHHDRGCTTPNTVDRDREVGGSFLASRPGSILTSVEEQDYHRVSFTVPEQGTVYGITRRRAQLVAVP